MRESTKMPFLLEERCSCTSTVMDNCDIRLAKPDQERVLAEGKARPHRWAPEQGYVTFMARNEKDLAPAMELIRMSHKHFAGDRRS